MALVDMLNAARQCDLLEVRLDRFGKAPDLSELLAAKPKPVIMSCRRPQDGGQWDGSENDRLTVLRQCIISKADYVEIELDVADQVRKFPPAKRVISYTNLEETPSNIAEIYAQAQTKSPDVIKLTTLARTPEEAWPLLQILARPALPTVVVGLGPASVMLSLLGKKIGAPWAYAALEKGMEAYEGQPTVNDLRQLYHYDAVESSTRFVGVTEQSAQGRVAAATLNAALAAAGLTYRCLPMAVGSVKLFRKVIDAARLGAVVAGEEDRTTLCEVANDLDAAAKSAKAVDLLLRRGETWHGFNLLNQAALGALEAVLRERNPADRPIKGRMVMVVGVNDLALGLAATLKEQGAVPILASRDKKAAHEAAQKLECRYVLYEAMYSTTHDVLIVCDEERQPQKPGGRIPEGIHSGYLKPSITVMDLTSRLTATPLLREAATRGCPVVSPRRLFLSHLQRLARMLTGKDAATEVLTATFDPLVDALEEEASVDQSE